MNRCCDRDCDKAATCRIFNGFNKDDPYDYTEMCAEHAPQYTNPEDRVEAIEQQQMTQDQLNIVQSVGVVKGRTNG